MFANTPLSSRTGKTFDFIFVSHWPFGALINRAGAARLGWQKIRSLV
ncbi:hypothetical protein [Alkanindiges hydrocarboniclasticus]|nr:hypothetical protein [Alkanindiges hydrocarboniclasticus]